MSPAIRLKGVRAGYRPREDILRGLDLEVPAGATVAVLGPSGGGKSTLLRAIAGLVPAHGGTVEVLGVRRPARPPRGSVGYVPQRLGLVRHATALENALQGALHETPAWRGLLRRPHPDVTARAHDALDAVGLADVADTVVHELSGGQQRRVATARALVQRPRLLLADEFLGELDPETAGTVLDAVRRMRETHGTTTVFVEHHLDQARRVADIVFRLEDGVLVPVDLGTKTHSVEVPA